MGVAGVSRKPIWRRSAESRISEPLDVTNILDVRDKPAYL